MPRPSGAFYDKRAGCWASSSIGELRETKDGRSYRTKVRNPDLRHPTKDRLAAQAWVAAELEARRLASASSGDPTFEHLSQYYLEDAERRVGPEALDRVAEHLDRFGKWPRADDPGRMDVRLARLVTRDDVERYRDALIEGGASPAYVAKSLLCTLKTCFRWASTVEPGRFPGLPLAANPLVGLKSPAIPRRKAREMDPVQVSRFIRWAWRRAIGLGAGPNGRHARSAVLLVMTLRDTGARPKELCVAEWDEWRTLPNGWGVIRLPAWKWKNGAKTGEDRIIAVPPHCARRIEALRGMEGRHPTRIFCHRRGRGQGAAGIGTAEAGEPWVWLDHARKRKGDSKALQKWFLRLREAGAEAGYPLPEGFRLYFARSAYTTEARRRGVNDVALAKSLGTSVRMLDRHYTDMDEADVLGAAMAAARPRTGDVAG